MQLLTARAPTVHQYAFPRASWRRDAALVVGFSLLLALSAQISLPLPFSPVPVTAQTLVVLLTGALLGSRLGALAILAYLAEGLAGLPVFAGGRSAWSPSALGVPVIIGPTAGYLLSWPLAAFLVGWLAERGWDRRPATMALAMLLGTLVIYTGGLLVLAFYVPASGLLAAGLLPFLPGDLAKIAIAAAVLPGGWALLRRAEGGRA
jgi:biotin transport system substrate-specific component